MTAKQLPHPLPPSPCCYRRYRLNKALAIMSLGVLTLLLMEYHVHRRFLSDIYSPQSPANPASDFLLLPRPSSQKSPMASTNVSDRSSQQQRQPRLATPRNRKPTGTNFSIFYNIYLNPSNSTDGIRIIEEQTRQFFTSDYHKDTPLYYNIIGYNYTQRFCPPGVTCQQLHYYPRGGEEVTLNDLHRYCQQNPLDQVIYLHNKGSFSPNTQNEIKRKFVTHALCRPRTLHDKTCNVLSHTWEPLPHFHCQSNMWLAKCSYIAKLLPLKEYEQRRIEMFRELLRPPPPHGNDPYHLKMLQNKRDKFQCLAMFFNRSSSATSDIYLQQEGLVRAVGMGRFMYELWVYSHPDVEPCDRDYTLGRPLTQRFDFTSKRFRYAWMRVPGRLWEYQYLYHQIPPKTSFFWKFFQNATNTNWPKYCATDPLLNKLQQPMLESMSGK